MHIRISLTLGFLATLAVGPAGSSTHTPSAALNRPAPGKSLEELLHEVSPPSGIRFRIASEVAHDQVQTRITGTAWPDVVRDLLRGYNYTGTWDAKGRLIMVSVTGRNGDGAAQSSAKASLPTNELFSYETPPARVPGRYKTYSAGSVYPIKVPAGKLRDMQKGAKVSVSLPDGRYDLIHDNTWHHDNGDVTWAGYVDGPQGHYRALLTVGEDGVEGQIRTPGGLYHVESEEDQDWLVDIRASGLRQGSLENDENDPSGLLLPSTVSPAAAAQPGKGRAMAHSPQNATVNSTGQRVIDVMLLYTSGLGSKKKALTKLNSILSFANQALADSQANATLHLAAAKRTNYPNAGSNDAALNDLTSFSNGFENVPNLRLRRGADIVLLVRPFKPRAQGGNCGGAWVNGSGDSGLESDLAFGVIGYGAFDGFYCSNYTLAHEVGHIMGATHDRAHARVPGKYTYSYGYGIDGLFGDIMSYFDPEVGLYANPNLVECAGMPCGIPSGQPRAADVVRTLNNTADTVSGFVNPASPRSGPAFK
jgi:hypothetical protein